MNRRAVTNLLGVLLILSLPLAQAEECSSPNPLHFSFISKTNVTEKARDYRPLLDLIQKKTGRTVEIILPTSYDTAIEGLLSGQIDFAELGPASYAQAKRRDSSIEAFATYARGQGAFNEAGFNYHSVLIVKTNSPYQDIKMLAKTKVSLVDPASTSGSLIPRVIFSAVTGMQLENYFSGIVYSGSHERSAQSVLNGYTDAAFVSSAYLDEGVSQGAFKSTDFRVLWKSAIIPNDPIVYRNKLCEPLKAQIRAVYFSDGKELAPLLSKLKIEKFVPVKDENYKIILEMVK
jgi:phosphonate transport system substrate-binding protein